jgi:hypothetical protein
MYKTPRCTQVDNVLQHNQHQHRNQWLQHRWRKLKQLKLLAD